MSSAGMNPLPVQKVSLLTVLASALKTGMKPGLVTDYAMMAHGVFILIVMNLTMMVVIAAMYLLVKIKD